jgi:hypothetical protein
MIKTGELGECLELRVSAVFTLLLSVKHHLSVFLGMRFAVSLFPPLFLGWDETESTFHVGP